MIKRLMLAVFLLSGLAFGQLATTGTNCTGTSSCTPTNATGDLQIAYAGRDLSATAPSLPAGWTSLGTASINGTSTADSAVRLACKVSTSANEASGTFSNAGKLIVMIYKGQRPGLTAVCATLIFGTPSFFTSTVNTTTTTETFNAVTNEDSALSWDVAFGFCSACTAGINTAPTGMTNRSSVTGPPAEGGHDTNGGVTSFSSANVTLTTAGRIITVVVEVKPLVVRPRVIQSGVVSPSLPVAAAVLPPGALESHGMIFVGGMLVAWALGRLWRCLRSKLPRSPV